MNFHSISRGFGISRGDRARTELRGSMAAATLRPSSTKMLYVDAARFCIKLGRSCFSIKNTINLRNSLLQLGRRVAGKTEVQEPVKDASRCPYPPIKFLHKVEKPAENKTI